MTLRLAGRVAVITGAGSGIGRATAELFHREGARVLLADISGLQAKVAEQLGPNALDVRCDVTKSDDIQNACATAEREFGRLDVMVNNAGTGATDRSIVDDDEGNIDMMLATNTRSVYLGIKHAATIMKRLGNGGSIVNTSSTAGLFGYPGMAAYGASKAGVIGLTYSAARELGRDGIRVNTICPGPTDTPLRRRLLEESGRPVYPKPEDVKTALGRIGRPEEIAYATLFLASDESSFVTGAVLPVDGGQRA